MAELNVPDFISRYGAQAALAISVPEILELLKKAVEKGYTKDQFIAEFMNTNWYKTHNESWRKAEETKVADPATFDSAMSRLLEDIKRKATQLGVMIDDTEAKNLADGLLKEYWNNSIPSDVLDNRIMGLATASKIYGGKTMSYKDSLTSYAASMGVKFDGGFFEQASKSIAAGTSTFEQWNQAIKDAAKSRFPMFAGQIDAGVTVDQIASPYKQTISSVLELPYAAITLDDPLIGQAFGSVGKDGVPAAMGLWDFEKMLKNDPRWTKTKNARSSLDAVGRKVLQDFGLAY